MEKLFRSGDIELAGHLARPRIAPGTSVPGLLICHGFPNLNQGGVLSARSFPELAERIATEMGWMVLVFNFRGAGDSDGNFSLRICQVFLAANPFFLSNCAQALLATLPHVMQVALHTVLVSIL